MQKKKKRTRKTISSVLIGILVSILVGVMIYDYTTSKRIQETNEVVAQKLFTHGNRIWFELKVADKKDKQKLEAYNQNSIVTRMIIQDNKITHTYNYMNGNLYGGHALTLKDTAKMSEADLIKHSKANQKKAIKHLAKTVKNEEADMDKVEAQINKALKEKGLTDSARKVLIYEYDNIENNRERLKENETTMKAKDGKPHTSTVKPIKTNGGDIKYTQVTVPSTYSKDYHLIFVDSAKLGNQKYVRLADVEEFQIVKKPGKIKNILVAKQE